MRVFFYKTGRGRSPVREYIDGLHKEDLARFLEVVEEIEAHGFSASRVQFKPIEGKLWEVKFHARTSGYRVFYCMLEKDIMVWLHAFSKKTQKTPLKEIEVARNRMKEIFRNV